MKAVVQQRYGGPEVLELKEVDQPGVVGNQVLVRVRAAAVNARDWHVMRGDPKPSAENLATLRSMAESRQLIPAIDRTYSLADTADALRYVETEHARAKVILTA